MRIILASRSPRRRELLGRIGIVPEIIPAEGEEVMTSSEPAQVVRELSRQKAGEILKKACGGDEEALIIGADTVVTVDGRILGKPGTEEKAAEMLALLQGRTHEVYTGVTVILKKGDKISESCFSEKTEVDVLPMTQEEIRAYTATGDPMDKAGAYGIQGVFSRHIRGIRGSYDNVVGLPVSAVYSCIRRMCPDGVE